MKILPVGLTVLTLSSCGLASKGDAPVASALIAEFRIDGAKEELNKILNILPQSNGTVVVLMEDESFARLYSDQGVLLKKFLRSGSGPGEVGSAYTSGTVADSNWVYDENRGRFTLFDQQGNFLRAWQQQPIGAWQDGSTARKHHRYLQPIQLLPNNRAIGRLGAAASLTASGEVRDHPIATTNWDGVVTSVINQNPRAARSMVVRTATLTSYGQQPFDNAQEFALSPDGQHIVIVDAYTPGLERFFYLTHISITGDTLFRSKIPYVPDRITPHTIDSTVAAVTRKRPEVAASYRAALYTPAYWPPVTRILVSNDGAAWLQVHTTDGTKRWLVVSPAGRVTTSVVMPQAIRLFRIDRGIWGAELDDDDVPSVVRYRLSHGDGN